MQNEVEKLLNGIASFPLVHSVAMLKKMFITLTELRAEDY
jgi:hypothetical protein